MATATPIAAASWRSRVGGCQKAPKFDFNTTADVHPIAKTGTDLALKINTSTDLSAGLDPPLVPFGSSVHLKAQIIRELDRLEVVLAQLKTVEAERDALLKPAQRGGGLTGGHPGAVEGQP